MLLLNSNLLYQRNKDKNNGSKLQTLKLEVESLGRNWEGMEKISFQIFENEFATETMLA